MKIVTQSICMAVLLITISAPAQDIFTYGNNSVSKQEFKKAFSKNNTDLRPSEKAYRDYLDLFIRFKLKVKAAYDLKLDTLSTQKAELNDFRRQIEQGFLTDDNSVKDLVHDAFLRSQKDIHLAHIFIALDSSGNIRPQNVTSVDTARAWKIAMTVYSGLEKGIDFGKLASSYSSDPSAQFNNGDMGYITAFTLPYQLENLAYSTPPGKFSKPFRSNSGYHIFKNLGERKAVGRIKIAQIVLAFPLDTTNDAKSLIKQRADSIYKALTLGASFTDLVERFSADQQSKQMHGEMPEFGVASFDPAFENAVFNLKKNGEISKPILTPVGYYIIKKLDQTPVNSDLLDDSAMAVLKQQVRNDPRIETARKAMSQKILRVTGFKKGPVPDSVMFKYAENVYFNKKNVVPSNITNKTVLFSFPEQTLYIGDFITNLQASRFAPTGSMTKSLNVYEEVMRRDYYRNRLDKYDADFAAQLKEFKEGNLLFEIMQRNIWDKASNDSVGLKAFYEKNKSKYWWESSADAIIISCTDSAIARSLKEKLAQNIKAWKEIVQPYESKVQADSGRFELTQLPTQQQTPVAGQLAGPFTKPGDNNVSFVYFVKLYSQKQQRDFDDAKGFVLNDYQLFLEEKWIAALKKKYPVKVNEAELKSLVK